MKQNDFDSHFKVTHDTGQVPEVSWSFVREGEGAAARFGEKQQDLI